MPGQTGTSQVNRPMQRVSASFADLLTDRAVAAADAEQWDLTGHVHVSLRWWEVADLTGTADSAGRRTSSATSTRVRRIGRRRKVWQAYAARRGRAVQEGRGGTAPSWPPTGDRKASCNRR